MRPTARTPLTPDRRGLADRYRPLAVKLARPFLERHPRDARDLLAVAMLALSEAARDYDAAFGQKFATFACFRVRHALLDDRRREAPRGYRISGDPPPSVGPLTPDAAPASPADHVRESDSAEAFEALLDMLPRQHAEVVRRLYADDMGQAEAAAAMGLSQSRVSHVKREALAMLARRLEARPCPRP